MLSSGSPKATIDCTDLIKLGMTLCMCDGGLLHAPYVRHVAPSSPAAEAVSILPGDQLLDVSGAFIHAAS
jgi:hypothetical protein